MKIMQLVEKDQTGLKLNLKMFGQVCLSDYIPMCLNSSYTRIAGQTMAFRNPNTPAQKPTACEIKYTAAPINPKPYTALAAGAHRLILSFMIFPSVSIFHSNKTNIIFG
jgi:hypothetical protein